MRTSQVPFDRASVPQPNLDYPQYRERAASERESVAHRSDSGYYTHPPHSIISNDADRYDPDLSSDMMQVGNMTVTPAPTKTADQFPNVDRMSQYSGQSRGKEIRCSEPDCREVSKCKSDHK
jgi:hypothetical protein